MVLDDVPCHHRQLGSPRQGALDSPARRRRRPYFQIGTQPINAQLAAYYNVARTTGAADWQLRTQIQFLFPR
jgi:hypothetical protein